MSQYYIYGFIALFCFLFAGYAFSQHKKQKEQGDQEIKPMHRVIVMIMWLIVGGLIVYSQFLT